MRFSKNGEIYKVIRITGSQDNYLGISFAEEEISDPEVIELKLEPTIQTRPFYSVINHPIITTKKEVKQQVLVGLDFINQSLGTNYQLSHIYFVPSDSCKHQVYKLLTERLIRHYHEGKEFKENSQK